jgi:peptidoglycan/xylan/chitin deacetylase (PgdA/CDA1 family)
MSRAGAVFSAAALTAASVFSVALFAATFARAENCPGHPDAIGTSRVLAINFDEYSQLGTMQYPQTLPLADKEVVLTFDDGPLPPSSNKILDILAAQCVKVTYFNVGEMAKSFPSVVRREYEGGHSIGTHSQDHPIHFERLTGEKLDFEIDQGIASVTAALGDPDKLAPFFRIPGLGRSPAVDEALIKRSLIVFSVDVVADDWLRHISPSQIVQRAMSRLEKHGKGILLLHDIHPWTAAALPELLKQLKAGGWHIVHVVPAAPGAAPLVASVSPLPKLASAIAEPSIVDRSRAAWPRPNVHLASADAVMPIPDAAAFDLDESIERDTADAPDTAGDAEWPALAAIAPPSSDAELPAPGLTDIGVNLKGEKLVGTELGLRPTLAVAPRPKPSLAVAPAPWNHKLHRAHLPLHRTVHVRPTTHSKRAELRRHAAAPRS